MNYEKSIYEFITENVGCLGKVDERTQLKEYSTTVKSSYDKKNIYKTKNELNDKLIKSEGVIPDFSENSFLSGFNDVFITKSNNVISTIDFNLNKIFGDLLKTFDSTALEKHLETRTIDITKNLDTLLEILNKEKNIDKKKLSDFCKENLLTTQNMYCMYIYLLLSKYTNLKEDKRLQSIILKIALIPEFTCFVNDILLDDFENPDYYRFFLAKRVKEIFYKIELILKMKSYNNETKDWIISNCLFREPLEFKLFINTWILCLNEKFGLANILKNWNYDAKTYSEIGYSLSSGIGLAFYSPQKSEYLKLLSVYADVFCKFSNDFNAFESLGRLYNDISSPALDLDFRDDEEKIALINHIHCCITTDETIQMLKENILQNNNYRYDICALIKDLDINELHLLIYNLFKQDPINNSDLVIALENNREIYKKALLKLYNSLNWNDIIGKYEKKDSKENMPDGLLELILHSKDIPELAVKVYAKTLRAKNFEVRKQTLESLHFFTCLDGGEINDEVKDSLTYLIKNESNLLLKTMAKKVLGNTNDVISFETASKLNLVNEDDKFVPTRVINLNENNIDELSLKEYQDGIYGCTHNKLLYLKKLNNELFAYCQGDNFEEEYTVKLKTDDNGILTKATCTCRKSKKDDNFCKHISTVLVKINKDYKKFN